MRAGATALVAAAAVGWAAAAAAQPRAALWHTLAAYEPLAGTLRIAQAKVLDAGRGEVGFSLSYGRDQNLFDTFGGERLDYRLQGAIQIFERLELGVAALGARIDAVDAVAPGGTQTNFGDTQLRIKGLAWEGGALALAGLVGLDLLQGVGEFSGVSDLATPSFAVLFSVLGEHLTTPRRLRLHVDTRYVYDRTINFLNGERQPLDFERFAWTMRDFTYLRLGTSLEFPAGAWLPFVEYLAEIPLGDGAVIADTPHTVAVGIKAVVVEHLVLSAALDLAPGGSATGLPARPLATGVIAASWRFGGAVQTAWPAAPAAETTPGPAGTAAQPATGEAEAASAPTSTPDGASAAASAAIVTEPAPSVPVATPAPAPTLAPEPEPNPAPAPPVVAPVVVPEPGSALEAQPAPQPEPTPAPVPEPAAAAPKPKPEASPPAPTKPAPTPSGGAVDLDQFEQ